MAEASLMTSPELFEGNYEEATLGGSLGWGKCVTRTSSYVDGETGIRTEIGQAVGTTPLVSSLDGMTISSRKSNQVWKSGRKQCAKLVLASGQWLEASLDHPVLTPDDYRELRALDPKDFVAVARRVPAPEKPLDILDEEVVVAAALILLKGKRVLPSLFGLNDNQLALFLRWLFTDGNVYTGSPRKIEIALASEGLIDDIQYLLRRFGIVARKSYRAKKNQDGCFRWRWRLQVADASTQIAFMERIGFVPGKEVACEELWLKRGR